jgi:threonine dehydratase
MSGGAVTFADVEAARRLIAGEVVETPCVASPGLGHLLGGDPSLVALKLENLQRTGSFKARGALAKLAGLSGEQRARGVVAMSAGNHAQGVAYHAQRLGIPATIVMPTFTPITKVEGTRRYGARVVLHGEGFDDAAAHARQLEEREGLAFVHPYDDPAIVAGQGTVGIEMLEAFPDLDALVVPIGGGGLIAGVAVAAKHLKPGIEVVGVEAALYPSVYRTLRGLPPDFGGGTIAEGIAVKTPGALNLPVIRELVADVLLVGEEAIEAAMVRLLEGEKVVAEGAGAAGVAAVLAHRERFAGRRVGVVVCGGNVDTRLLSFVLLRGLAREGRLARLRVAITDQPGALGRVANLVGEGGGNIVEVQHGRAFSRLPAKSAELEVIVEARGPDHVREIVNRLTANGFPVSLLEGAEAHVR